MSMHGSRNAWRARIGHRLAPLSLLGLCAFAVAQERGEIPPYREYRSAVPGRSADSIDAVERLVERFRDAWGRQDTEALVRLHADDVEWINAYGRIFRGAEPLGDFLENRLFPAFSPEVSRIEAANMRRVSMRVLGDAAAVVHLYTEGNRGGAAGGDGPRRTHVHLVVEARRDGWRIVHVAIMDVRDG